MSPYTDVEWTAGVSAGGDETKLNDMADTIAFLRDDMTYRPAVAFAGTSEGADGVYAGASAATQCFIIAFFDGSGPAASSWAADGAWHLLDFSERDIASETPGQVIEIQLSANVDLGGGLGIPVGEVGRSWFIRTEEDTRLRIDGWVSFAANGWYQDHAGTPVANRIWTQMRGFSCQLGRAIGTGDSRWSDVAFDGPTPGPAELVSDTDMNQMKTNQDVIRDRLRVKHIGGSALHEIGHALNWGGSLEDNHGLRFQVFVGGLLVGTFQTPFQQHTTWTTYSGKNLPLPNAGWAGLQTAEIRVQYANASSPTLWVGHDGDDGSAVGADGWHVCHTKFWQTPEDEYIHAFVAPRTWKGQDIFLGFIPGWYAFKTVGTGLIVTNSTIP